MLETWLCVVRLCIVTFMGYGVALLFVPLVGLLMVEHTVFVYMFTPSCLWCEEVRWSRSASLGVLIDEIRTRSLIFVPISRAFNLSRNF